MFNLVFEGGKASLGLGFGEAEVGGLVVKMVPEDKLDVLVSFDDGWAKIFVALDNKELGLSPQVAKGFALVRV